MGESDLMLDTHAVGRAPRRELTTMGEDDRVIILEQLGYDPDDIIDRNLTIERDGDELVVVDDSGDQVARHAEPEGVCDVDLDALDVELPRGFERDWTCLANAAPRWPHGKSDS